MPQLSSNPTDVDFMRLALEQAEQSSRMGEVPVGAIVVAPDGRTILGRGHNQCIEGHDPSAHAEIQAMRQAAQALGNYRLEGCTLYVTLEPCAMCSGAMLHARLAQVVYALPDPRTGAAGSVLDLFAASEINHQTSARCLSDEGDSAEVRRECSELLTGFFRKRRQQQARQRTQAESAPLREDALRPPARALAGEGVWQKDSRWSLVPDPRDPSAAAWRVHVLESGNLDAPCVVLLHGYAGCGHLWQELRQAATQAGWRVLAPDLPGHGLSDKPRQPALHTLEWQQAMLQAWLERQNLPEDWLLVTLDQSVLLAPAALPAHRVLALEYMDAIVRWPDTVAGDTHTDLNATLATAKDWRQRCQRSPRFDLPEHWALDDHPKLGVLCQASYPDAGHRGALRWPLFAAQALGDADRAWWQAHGQRRQVHALEPAPAKLPQPGARIRAALRHNIPWILHWLEQHRAAPPNP